MGIWTPAPISGAPVFATPQTEILPTVTARPPTATPRPAPTATVTPDPNLVIITEADIAAAVTGGATAGSGLAVDGLTVRFTDGRMTLAATRIGWSGINVTDLTLVGRLQVKDGKLELVTESVTPGGLITALIPPLANQALAQYTAQWYIEEVRTLDGRLEVRIR